MWLWTDGGVRHHTLCERSPVVLLLREPPAWAVNLYPEQKESTTLPETVNPRECPVVVFFSTSRSVVAASWSLLQGSHGTGTRHRSQHICVQFEVNNTQRIIVRSSAQDECISSNLQSVSTTMLEYTKGIWVYKGSERQESFKQRRDRRTSPVRLSVLLQNSAIVPHTLYPGTIQRPLETSSLVFSSIDFSAAATSSCTITSASY